MKPECGSQSTRILVGDVRKTILSIPDRSVHCIVTSPPYYGLRDYGHDDQIGAEASPEAFTSALVEVFRECRRILRDDGTLWLNLGDSYASSGGNRAGWVGETLQCGTANQNEAAKQRPSSSLAPKQLIGIPWRVAFALQADGWWLRQDIIWAKPNPMPESVIDRCTKAHEYLFLLSKSERYYFDAKAIQEPAISMTPSGNGFVGRQGGTSRIGPQRGGTGSEVAWSAVGGTRNRRSVWTVATQPFIGAHFATFPPALIEPCILAGCPRGGTVLDPFGGAGTTGLVASRLGRYAVLCEINPEYAEMAADRIRSESPLFSSVSVVHSL